MTYLLKNKILLIIILSGLAGGSIAVYKNIAPEPEYLLSVVKRADLVQEVNVTGKVIPNEIVNLAFEKSGKVSAVLAEVGDMVWSGQALVYLENGDIVAQLNQAKANSKAQLAQLEELKKGTRAEEVNIQEIKVTNAKAALLEASKNLIDKLKDSYTKSDDAIRIRVDQFLSNPRSGNPQLNFSLSDQVLEILIERERTELELLLNAWRDSYNNLEQSNDLGVSIQLARQNLERIKLFMNNATIAVSILAPSSGLSQTTIDGYRADVSTGRTNVNTAISNLSTAEEKLQSATSALSLAREELSLSKAGVIPEKIAAQEARLEEAEASVANYQALLAKTVIRSPIVGIVTKQDAKIGEIVPANTVIVSVISSDKFEVEARVPEIDIAKINIGDKAIITLDAYGGSVQFLASIYKIDPAETVVEGVATYKITLKFDEDDARIKSGLTANIDVVSGKKIGVLVVPQRSLIARAGIYEVKVLEGDKVIIKEVTIGLRGSDGNVEILSGLEEGEIIIIPQ